MAGSEGIRGSMLPGEKIRFELIGSLYEAAAYPDRWQDFLQLAVKQCAGERAGLTVHTDRKNTALTVQGIGFPAEATREYNAYYGARNPLVVLLNSTTTSAASMEATGS